MNRSFTAALLTLTLLSSGCPESPPPAAAPADASAPADAPPAATEPAPADAAATAPAADTTAATPVALDAREVPVKCGCKLPVKKCSEWADLDGEWVQMTGHGLGSMPFCGKEGVRARVSGQVTDGKLQVTSITVLPPPG